MRMSLLLFALAACSHESAALVDAQPLQSLTLDVLVSDRDVLVYTGFGDVASTSCHGGGDAFPALGACATDEDLFDCSSGRPATCLTSMTLEVGGATVATADLRPGWFKILDAPPGDSATLVIDGCGGHARMPLGAPPQPGATVSASYDAGANAIVTTWHADTPAQQAILTFGNGTWDYRCRTGVSPYTFAPNVGIPTSSFDRVGARALAGPTIASTEFGDARIWSGGGAGTTLIP